MTEKVLLVDDDKEFLEELKSTLALTANRVHAVDDSYAFGATGQTADVSQIVTPGTP